MTRPSSTRCAWRFVSWPAAASLPHRPYATQIDGRFGERLHLLGTIEPLQLQGEPGQQTALTLVWQAADAMDADYTTTIQWLNEEGIPAAQVDLSLPGGTSNWLPNQVELQSVVATLPEEPGVTDWWQPSMMPSRRAFQGCLQNQVRT
ncbi:MAG: hypothetical protein HC802_08745 [Caldilineaceae bacterium]|nr:hypothetical protein [Caldilineaceae bacterium]